MPSIMSKELMQAFDIDASGFGALSAAYMFAYAPMQLPVGLLMDRFGARRLLTIAAFICAIGNLLFGITDSFYLAQFGRFLTGMGSAFGFVGFIYVCNHWFSTGVIALVMGMGNAIGLTGAVLGQGPLSYIVNHSGWRETMFGISIAGAALGAIILLFIRNDPEPQNENSRPSMRELFTNLGKIVRCTQTWVTAGIGAFSYIPTAVFGGLWCVPFIMNTYHVNNTTAGYAASMIYIGWILGSPILGHYSDIVKRRKPFYLVTALFQGALFVWLIYFPPQLIAEAFILLILIGIAASSQLLTFSTSVELNAPEAKGSAIAFINFSSFLTVIFGQILVGYLLDLHWTGQMEDGLRVYSASAYDSALFIFPVVMLLTFIIGLFLKEKHQQDVCDYIGG